MDWKRLGKKLFFPPIWVMVLLTVVGAIIVTMSVLLIVRATKEIRRDANGTSR